MLSSGVDAVTVGVDDLLAIFLSKGTELPCRQDVEHGFGRSAEPYPERRHDERAVDEDRMLHHRIDQGVIAQAFVSEAEVGVRRALFAEQVARAYPGALDHLFEERARRRRLQILDDMRFDPALRISASVLREVPHSGLW